MGKKMLCLLAAAILSVASLSACSGGGGSTGESDEAILKDAITKTSELKEQNMAVDMVMTMEMQGQTVEMSTAAEMWVKNADANDLTKMEAKMNMAIGMDLNGSPQTTDMVMYIDKGDVYVETQGQKVKTTLDAVGNVEGLVQTQLIPDDMITGFTVSTTDGEKVYDLTLDSAKFNEYMEQSLGSLAAADSGMGDSLDGTTYEFTNIKTSVTIKDGFVISQKVTFDMSMTVEGTAVTGDVSMTVDYTDPGKAVKIDFPDFSEYQDMTGMAA